jgi:HEAT repeat protein
MDANDLFKTLQSTPPWDWPADAGNSLRAILADGGAEDTDRILAAELAGEFSVLDDELAGALLAIVRSGDASDDLRCTAVISLGPALEDADTMGFEDADDALLSEPVFREIQDSLRSLFMDADLTKNVRRRILEASVRAPEDWHEGAVRTAYASGDEAWQLTAVFCMRCIIRCSRGFEDEILEALESQDPSLHYHAVCAAGSWEVDAAWPHIEALVSSNRTDKELRLAAMEAAAGIRPNQARGLLDDLTESRDDDIVEAAYDMLAMIEGLLELEDPDTEDDDEYF